MARWCGWGDGEVLGVENEASGRAWMTVQVWGHQVSYFSSGIKLLDEWSTVVRAHHCDVVTCT